ncbi:MAG: N-acetyltransferase [Polyangia bacterium]|jgi:ribosomal protein S18 acetylase RimI-like enzyme|nr:N-acetyltransferase [Polyangia bacterium]
MSLLGALAHEAFSLYGSDYGLMIPAYARDTRVITLVCELSGALVGFLQVGFLEPRMGRRGLVADILAVAVVPAYQGKGLGTALFERALELLEPMLERGSLSTVQLTVADTNLGASRLFDRLGFEVLDEDYGTYEGGQRAIRMSLGERHRLKPSPGRPGGDGQTAP